MSTIESRNVNLTIGELETLIKLLQISVELNTGSKEITQLQSKLTSAKNRSGDYQLSVQTKLHSAVLDGTNAFKLPLGDTGDCIKFRTTRDNNYIKCVDYAPSKVNLYDIINSPYARSNQIELVLSQYGYCAGIMLTHPINNTSQSLSSSVNNSNSLILNDKHVELLKCLLDYYSCLPNSLEKEADVDDGVSV